MFNFATSITYLYMVSATSKIVIWGQYWEFSPCFYSCIPPHTHDKDIRFLSDKSQRFFKIVAWIFLSCYMDLSKLIQGFLSSCYIDLPILIFGFLKAVTWICHSCYMSRAFDNVSIFCSSWPFFLFRCLIIQPAPTTLNM